MNRVNICMEILNLTFPDCFCPGVGVGGGQAKPGSFSKPSGSGRGGGAAGGGGRDLFALKMADGSLLCTFYQEHSGCRTAADECVRGSARFKHLCAAKKANGSFCLANHPKKDHK